MRLDHCFPYRRQRPAEVPSTGRHGRLRLPALRLGLAVLLAFAGAGQAVQAEPLGQVVEQVLRRHPDIRSSQAMLDVAGERVHQARSNFYPSVGLDAVLAEAKDLELSVEKDRSTRRIDAFLRWNLFRGQADRYAVRTAEADSRAASIDLADAHENVALQVTGAYLEVLRLRKRLELAQAYVRDSQRLTEDVRKRAVAGKVAAADVDQARMSVIEAQWQAARLQGQLAGAESRFDLLAGTKAGELQDPGLVEPAARVEKDRMMERVLAENPRVRAALARTQARSEEVGVAASALYPTLTLSVRKRLQTEIDPPPVTEALDSAQLQFTYEVPLGGSTYSRKREAVARKEAAQATSDAILLEARTNLSQVWTLWEETRLIAPRLAERVESGGRVVSAHDLQFTAGRRSLQDLISIRAEYFRALSDAIDNRYEQETGAAQILSLLGQLRSTLAGEAPQAVPAAQGREDTLPSGLAALSAPLLPCEVCAKP